jgi:hypothetical protein
MRAAPLVVLTNLALLIWSVFERFPCDVVNGTLGLKYIYKSFIIFKRARVPSSRVPNGEIEGQECKSARVPILPRMRFLTDLVAGVEVVTCQ